MIKINLIAEGRRPVAARPTKGPGVGPEANLGLWSLLGLTAAGVLVFGAHFFLLSRQVSAKEAEVATAQKEVDELAPFIKEVEDFKAKKAELERKVQVISALKANQRGPVQIMDQVSRALPELLWLDRMEVGSTTITLRGEAFNTNAVANFIENLDRVPEFSEPILQDTSQKGQVYTFVLVFPYSYAQRQVEGDDTAVSG